MMYLGNKAVGITYPRVFNFDKVALGTEDLSVFDDVVLSDEITEIVQDAFKNLPIKNITGNAVTSIATGALSQCHQLKNIIFPNVEIIGDSAFRETVDNINASPFLKTERIGNNAFRNCGINYIVAPNVIQVGEDAFYANNVLKCLDIGNRNIANGFIGTRYCFEPNAKCIVILRYGYVLPAQSNWFYSTTWFANKSTPGTLYVWQDLIDGYKNHEVWGSLTTANNNIILPIEGSIYEHAYGDGTLIE